MVKCITVEFEDGVIAKYQEGKWHANAPLFNRYLFLLGAIWKAARNEIKNEKDSKELPEKE